MNKYTPGPWGTADWSQFDGPNQDVIEACEPDVVEPGRSSIWRDGIRRLCIASVRDSSVDAETTKANARLIAAAPELLEALKSLYHMVQGECPSLLDEDSGGSAHLDILIRAAIPKAEGTK